MNETRKMTIIEKALSIFALFWLLFIAYQFKGHPKFTNDFFQFYPHFFVGLFIQSLFFRKHGDIFIVIVALNIILQYILSCFDSTYFIIELWDVFVLLTILPVILLHIVVALITSLYVKIKYEEVAFESMILILFVNLLYFINNVILGIMILPLSFI